MHMGTLIELAIYVYHARINIPERIGIYNVLNDIKNDPSEHHKPQETVHENSSQCPCPASEGRGAFGVSSAAPFSAWLW